MLIFDFNPWIYSKRSNLTSEYIKKLQSKLDSNNENETWQDLAEVLKELHPILTPPLWNKCFDFVMKYQWAWFVVPILLFVFYYQQLFNLLLLLLPFKAYLALLPLFMFPFLDITSTFYLKIKIQRKLRKKGKVILG